MFSILEMINRVVIEKREYLEFLENVEFRLDRTMDDNIVLILVDEKHNPLSSMIRGFGSVNDMNEWLVNKLGLSYNNDKLILEGNPIPPFQDAVINTWERN